MFAGRSLKGDFYQESYYREEGTLRMHHEVLAHNARLNAEEARRAAARHALRGEYRSYGWSDAQNRAASKFMLSMAIPYGGVLKGIGAAVRLGSLSSKIGSISIPVFRVYGGKASMLGKSYTIFNPKYVPFYRNFAGLPHVNTGQYLLRGSVELKNIHLGKAFAAPLDGNTGGLPLELYLKFDDIISPRNIILNSRF